MAEESEKHGASAAATGADSAAAAIALGHPGTLDPRAAAFLEKQGRLSDKQSALADLQIDTLQKQDEFETSHLRWRRFNDQMKGAMQIIAVAIGALFVFGIGAAVWSAAHDDGVVIEAFNVPPDMSARGLSGSVVSSMLLDRLTALQSRIDSARAPSSYASKGDDIKVQIPDTGISISEAYRYLVGWLGHQTHISGDVYRSVRGITVVVRTSGSPGRAFEGGDDTLGDLMEHAAESVYRQTQPFRYGVYLLNNGRDAEADDVLGHLAADGPASEKPWAYAVWMYTAFNKSDLATGMARAETGAALDPHNVLAQINSAQAEAYAGHDEQVLRYDRATMAASAAGGGEQLRPESRQTMGHEATANIAEETADFGTAVAQYDIQFGEPDTQGSHWSAVYLKAVDLAKLHDVEASRRALGGFADVNIFARSIVGAGWNQNSFDFPQFQALVAQGKWADARKDLEQVLATPAAQSVQERLQVGTAALPWLALAEAKTGDFASAWTTIGKTPIDCYLCLRMRGEIAAAQKTWNGAAYWFGRAVTLAPSIPFAYTEWGAMLMRRGDIDGAMAKFAIAHQKGPHFADPLEMWGEALIAKNRSDLALAKFEEASKYAPNWGRLHLKWGEALWWSGHRDDAKKQFAIASGLDLTASEMSELARVEHSHG